MDGPQAERKVPTGWVPVIFDPEAGACSVIFVAPCRNKCVTKAPLSSDNVGQQIALELVTIYDDGRCREGLGHAPSTVKDC